MEVRGAEGWSGLAPDVEVLVVERHPVFRAGIESCLNAVDGIARVEAVGTVADAWAHPAAGESDAVLVDAGIEGAVDFVSQVLEFVEVGVVALADRDEPGLLEALVDAGAAATLVREDLTAGRLSLSLRAVAGGASTMLATDRRAVTAAASPATDLEPGLTEREQRVLALVADGSTTRRIGEELHFSDRTVKKVLGDAVDKLGARGRSQAIAYAVRRGLI